MRRADGRGMARPGRRLALAVAGLCGLAACAAPPAVRPPDLLLIVIDTLRADRLGCYGSTRGLTPFLDSLAARGILYHAAYAPSSWTNPSVASILTARFPSQHGVVSFGSVLAATEVTLPEVLAEHGFATGGVVANSGLLPGLGFAQGFRDYVALPHQLDAEGDPLFGLPQRAPVVNAEGLAWLDGVMRGANGGPPGSPGTG